ncbi:MAG: hypothetical protein ABJD11_15285 [Gemmatimonadota bacterium]
MLLGGNRIIGVEMVFPGRTRQALLTWLPQLGSGARVAAGRHPTESSHRPVGLLPVSTVDGVLTSAPFCVPTVSPRAAQAYGYLTPKTRVRRRERAPLVVLVK